MAQMNDLQAQLEESNKEKQELQEKVGTLGSPGSESSGTLGMKPCSPSMEGVSLYHRAV